MWITSLIGAVSTIAGDWFKSNREVAKAKHEAKIEQIKATKDWETLMAEGSIASWKDELWTIVLAIPVVVIMYAVAFGDTAMIDRMHMGFEVLTGLPEYYQYLLYVAVLASFGIKGIDKFVGFKK